MSYFNNFDPTLYKFGNETSFSLATNLTQYADLVDQVKDQVMMVDDYTIPANERPDQTSFKIYGTTDFLLDVLFLQMIIYEKRVGITLKVETAAEERYPHRMVTCALRHQDVVDYYDETNSPIMRTKIVGTAPDNFEVGRVVTGNVSGTIGKIIDRDLSLGTFIIDTQSKCESGSK